MNLYFESNFNFKACTVHKINILCFRSTSALIHFNGQIDNVQQCYSISNIMLLRKFT